jgi:hypothetical protein
MSGTVRVRTTAGPYEDHPYDQISETEHGLEIRTTARGFTEGRVTVFPWPNLIAYSRDIR